jgi:hypothetical protein
MRKRDRSGFAPRKDTTELRTVMTTLRRLLKVIIWVAGGYVAVCLVIWAAAFVDRAPRQDNCTFGSIASADYRKLLSQASAQDWTVWPDLSRGLFWPSNDFLHPQSRGYHSAVERALLLRARALTPSSSSFHEQLAAIHALMRSINAEFVLAARVKELQYFTYYLPYRRFAPLCPFCFLYGSRDSDITFAFEENERGFHLVRVVVRHPGLKFQTDKNRLPAVGCPSPQGPH